MSEQGVAKSRINGHPAEHAILVTGSARMETFRQEQDKNHVAIRRAGQGHLLELYNSKNSSTFNPAAFKMAFSVPLGIDVPG